MGQKYLVNVGKKDIRVAVVEDGHLVQLLVEPTEERPILGNIYKGVVSDVKPGIRAVFVDIGLGRNAFLHFDDIHRETVEFSLGLSSRGRGRGSAGSKSSQGRHGRDRSGDPFDPARALRPGDPLMVQVIKEEIGLKGPRVSTHISLPGRYLVLLPFAVAEGGVSRKIEDAHERRRLRRILAELAVNNKGYIVRTAGSDQPASEIKSDVGYLDRAWRSIRRKFRMTDGPALIYNDHDILYRLVRDVVQSSAEQIWVDSRPEYRQLRRLVEKMIPPLADKVFCYSDPLKNVFEEFEIEKQIQKALRRKVWLRNGGFLIFDEMEAMTAIDVNTGKYTGGQDQSKTVYRTNLEAARTIAHQLRLRDIGGLIVIDFIDMEDKQYQKNLLAEFKRLLRQDKAKTAVLGFSEFGLVEMTRKRVRHSLKGFFLKECPVCAGAGEIFTPEQVWRNIRGELVARLASPPRPSFVITVHPDNKEYIEREHQATLRKWQRRYRIKIELVGDATFPPGHHSIREQEQPKRRRRPSRSATASRTRQRG